MKRNLHFTLIFFAFIFSFNLLTAQHLIKEMPLSQQVSSSEQIVEGEVIKTKSMWNANRTHIYTVNTIKVYKVFKGEALNEIQVITPGGVIGLQAERVTPSLNLSKSDLGIFFLSESKSGLSNGSKIFDPYGSVQGFYRYELSSDVAVNTFNRVAGISTKMYSNITNLTRKDYVEITSFNAPNNARIAAPGETLAIESISPLTASAGTETVLTITGTGFLSVQGTVSFPDADTGGTEYKEVYEPQIISWSSTEILVMIPSFAGTGPVRVTTTTGTNFQSEALTIIYAHINLIPDDADPVMEYPTQLINDNGSGGYTWRYNQDFNINTAARESFRRAFDTWVCNTGVNWIIGSPTVIAASEFDNINIITFDDFDQLPENILGRATSYFNGCFEGSGPDVNWFVVELDIIFDDDANWNFGPDLPVGNEIDFETVAVHELGHALQLAHIIDPGAIMHYNVAPRTANRDPEENDIVGAEAIFNRSANDPVCGQPVMTQSACSLSTEDILAANISIYPNPANKNFSIKTSSNISIESISMHDVLGKRVLSSKLDSSSDINIINVDNLSPGVYFARIISEQGSLVKKVIIE